MFDWFRRKQAAPAGRKMTSADLADLLRCGPLSSSGAPVTPERAMRVATVYACVRILAESVAQLPCKIYRRDETGREQVESGPLFDLMHFPNPWQNSFEFREHLMACLCLRGNFFALMSRRRGEVIELLPLRPEAVSVQRRNWELLYTYTDANGRTATVGADKMLHVRGLSLDGIMGVSPIRYGRDAIGLAMATEKHGALMFRNGARPGGVLKHPAKLSDEALEHLKISWEAAHGGDNAGRTAILEEGMSYESVSMTNEDAQYLDTRQFQRNEICALFRVPPHMVGDLTKSSFSNITQQSLEFVKYSVLPWCRRIETAFWRSLLTDEQRREGYRVEFLVDGLERADIKTRYESYSIAIQNGILSPNECRRLENRNPREGGDVFLQPLNMVDGRQAGEVEENEEEKKENAVEKAAAYLSGQFGEDLKALAKDATEEMRAAAEALKAATPGGPMVADAATAEPDGRRSSPPGDAPLAHMAAIIGAMEAQAFQHQDEIARIMAAGKAATSKGPSSGWGSAESAEPGKAAFGQGPAGSEPPATPPVRYADSPAFSFGHRTASHALGKAKEGALECGASRREMKAAEDDDEPEHDDWAEVEWSEEVAGFNTLLLDYQPKFREVLQRIVDNEADRLEALFARRFGGKAFDRDLMDALEKLYADKPFRAQIKEGLHPLMRAYANLAAVEAARKAGGREAVITPHFAQSVEQYVDIYLNDYTASSLAQLKALIRDADRENLSAVLAKRVGEWRQRRAGKETRTVSVAALNYYAKDQYRKYGVAKLRWITQGGKACPFCRQMDNTVVGIDDFFVGKGGSVTGEGGASMRVKKKVKHPPLHRGCVCAVVPEVAKFEPTTDVDRFIALRDVTPDHLKGFISPHTAEYYKSVGAEFYLSETGNAGFAIARDDGNELISAFSLPGTTESGNLVYEAIRAGAKQLWCFDTILPEMYGKFGFKEVGRIPWDDKYAPTLWNYDKFKKPAVVHMVLEER